MSIVKFSEKENEKRTSEEPKSFSTDMDSSSSELTCE
jgi:hypothetical protein